MFHYSDREAAVSDPSGLSEAASFPLARSASVTRPPTTRTSLPGHSPGKASRVISPPLVVLGINPVGDH